jgi:transcription initiation factor TFIID subunit 6
MSVIPKDTIKVIAETIGITNITDELASALGPDVEYRIRDIVQVSSIYYLNLIILKEAFKYMHHSKRSKLLCQDVNRALKLKNLESLFGYSNKTPLNFQKAGNSNHTNFI